MRRLYITAAILVFSAGNSVAQSAPMFRPIDESMVPASGAVASPLVPQAPLPVSHSGETIDSEGSGAIPSLPLDVMTENGISYLSGGVSDEETEQLKSLADDYNLRLLLTGLSGEFLGGATMVLKDASGAALLTLREAGPEVYARVPAGKYTVEVTNAAGVSKSTALTVPATGAVKTQIRL